MSRQLVCHMTIKLETVLEPAVLRRVWKDIRRRERKVHLYRAPLVRDSTGGIAFDLNLPKNLQYLRTRVLEGTYRPHPPLVIESAKTNLLRRRLSFLNIEDSLILGSLVHSIRPSLIARMPEWVSFGRGDNNERVSENTIIFDYEDWWTKWLRYRNLLKLIEDDPNPLLVTSDIVNFFGSVDLSLLRSKITGVTSLEGQANDLLFFLLAHLLPSYNYEPKGLFGLPVVGDDTSRILAHYYLLDLDSALSQEGSDSRYTRWVDDMVVSVPNYLEGVEVISRIENALERIGLVANSSKTEIISKETFRERHYLDDNEFLDSVDQATMTGQHIDKREFHKYLHTFLDSSSRGYRARVLRRYYTQSRKLRSKTLLRSWNEHLREFPGNAQSILDYVSFFEGTLGFCTQLFDFLKTHGALFEEFQILLYETLLLKPFPNDIILRNYVVRQCYLHYGGLRGFTRPGGYVRGLQSLVMFKFGGVRAAKLVARRFAHESVESPTFATYAFPVIAADRALRTTALEVIEHIEDPRIFRLKALVEHLVNGEKRATGLLIGLLDPRETKLPGRYVVNARALPLLEIARGTSNSARSSQLRQAVKNTAKKLRTADSSELIDRIALSHL